MEPLLYKKVGDRLALKKNINTITADGSNCTIYLLYPNGTIDRQVGIFVHGYPGHWMVKESVYVNDLQESRFTFPYYGNYTIVCCFATTYDMGSTNVYVTNHTTGDFPYLTHQCPDQPAANVSCVDTFKNLYCRETIQSIIQNQDWKQCLGSLQNVIRQCNCLKSCNIPLLCQTGKIGNCCVNDNTTLTNFLLNQKICKNNGQGHIHKRMSIILSASSRFFSLNTNTTARYVPIAAYGTNWAINFLSGPSFATTATATDSHHTTTTDSHHANDIAACPGNPCPSGQRCDCEQGPDPNVPTTCNCVSFNQIAATSMIQVVPGGIHSALYFVLQEQNEQQSHALQQSRALQQKQQKQNLTFTNVLNFQTDRHVVSIKSLSNISICIFCCEPPNCCPNNYPCPTGQR